MQNRLSALMGSLRRRPEMQRTISAGSRFVANIVVSSTDFSRAMVELQQVGFDCAIDRRASDLYAPDILIRAEKECVGGWEQGAVSRVQISHIEELLTSHHIDFRILTTQTVSLPPLRSKSVHVPGDRSRITVLASSQEDEERALTVLAQQLNKDKATFGLRPDLSAPYQLPIIYSLFSVLLVALGWGLPFLPDRLQTGIFLAVLFAFGFAGLVIAHSRGLLRPVLQQSAILITVCAALTYALVRYIYVRYYEPFHVSPEEIGLDYRAILSEQFTYIVRRWSQGAALVLGAYALYRFIGEHIGRSERARPFRLWFLLNMAVLIVALGFNTYKKDLNNAREAGWNVSHGAIARQEEGPFSWPEVFRAVVDPAPSSREQSSFALSPSNLIYLGVSQNVTTLFDADTVTTMRVPNAAYIVRTYRTARILAIKDSQFRSTTIQVPRDTAFTITVINDDVRMHELNIEKLGVTRTISSARTSVRLPPLDRGLYTFLCKIHAGTMHGSIISA